MKNTKGLFLLFISVILLILFILWYIFLPAINLQSEGLWLFSILATGIISFITWGENIKHNFISIATMVCIIVLFIMWQPASSKVFNAESFSSIITLEDGNFEDDIKEVSFDQIPKIDRDTAIRLGDRKMGDMINLVSQFNVSSEYTQINKGNRPVRVTPLKYNGFLKWLNNKNEGIPGYIVVDMVTGEAKLEKLENGIKYSNSDKFSRNIKRYLRFNYLTSIFGEINFEVDDYGIPHYVAPIYKSTVGVFGAKDVTDVVIVNAINGEHQKYKLEDVPKWVDKVYDANTIINQLNWHGTLHSGFLNSIFSQRGVLKTTEGYNYLAIDNDVYLYTGITSTGKDESNVGFVLVNLRNKDAKFYKVSSAEEYSAMDSAKGAVQEKNYVPTFPLLLNIDGKPTYFMSLKDGAGLIKMYAFVDATDYQRVSVGETVEKAMEVHLGKEVKKEENIKEIVEENKEILTGKITDIKEVIINGNSHYYFTLDVVNGIMVANINISHNLPFVKEGNNIQIEFHRRDEINIVTSLKLIN